mmetsp:Transcript_7283/g.16651  ORF Transcript_7283/g.16651 Transcript_7283/m.16651 type:complete len:354 (-) Transcript_7283:789-1850(-)
MRRSVPNWSAGQGFPFKWAVTSLNSRTNEGCVMRDGCLRDSKNGVVTARTRGGVTATHARKVVRLVAHVRRPVLPSVTVTSSLTDTLPIFLRCRARLSLIRSSAASGSTGHISAIMALCLTITLRTCISIWHTRRASGVHCPSFCRSTSLATSVLVAPKALSAVTLNSSTSWMPCACVARSRRVAMSPPGLPSTANGVSTAASRSLARRASRVFRSTSISCRYSMNDFAAIIIRLTAAVRIMSVSFLELTVSDRHIIRVARSALPCCISLEFSTASRFRLSSVAHVRHAVSVLVSNSFASRSSRCCTAASSHSHSISDFNMFFLLGSSACSMGQPLFVSFSSFSPRTNRDCSQ